MYYITYIYMCILFQVIRKTIIMRLMLIIINIIKANLKKYIIYVLPTNYVI